MEVPTVQWDDIGGHEWVKQILKEVSEDIEFGCVCVVDSNPVVGREQNTRLGYRFIAKLCIW